MKLLSTVLTLSLVIFGINTFGSNSCSQDADGARPVKVNEFLNVEIDDPAVTSEFLGFSYANDSHNDMPVQLDVKVEIFSDGKIAFVASGNSHSFVILPVNTSEGETYNGLTYFQGSDGKRYSVEFGSHNYRNFVQVESVPDSGAPKIIFRATSALNLPTS